MTLTPEKIEMLVNRVRHNQEVGENLNTFSLRGGEHDDMVAALDIANDFLAGRLVRSAPPAPTADTERLNWLEGETGDYCNRDMVDRFGAKWVFFDSERAISENDVSGERDTLREAIDAARGEANR